MPLGLVGMHFIAWVLVPGFSATEASPTWLRTYVYILPLLCLGLGYVLAEALYGLVPGSAMVASGSARAGRGPWMATRTGAVAAAVVAGGLAAGHLALRIPSLIDPARAAEELPSFADEYLKGQGRLGAFVLDVHRALGGRSALLTWDYMLQDLYASLAPRDGRPSAILPSLDIMRERARGGSLRSYLARRKLTLEPDASVFLVARTDQSPADLLDAASDVLGPNGFAWGKVEDLSRVATWNTEVPVYGNIVLYHVSRMRWGGL